MSLKQKDSRVARCGRACGPRRVLQACHWWQRGRCPSQGSETKGWPRKMKWCCPLQWGLEVSPHRAARQRHDNRTFARCAMLEVADAPHAKQDIVCAQCCGMEHMFTLVTIACLLCGGFASSAHGLGPAVGCDTPAYDIAFEDGSAIVNCPANCQARCTRALAREQRAESSSRW